MISVEHLTKCYGDFCAVSDLSFEIEEGHVYGFLGPNGAGKSTTMNIMTGCLSPTDGHVKIGGFDIFDEPMNAKKLIGYLPEQPPLYLTETPLEYLKFVGEAKGLKGDELWEQIDYVIRLTKIEDVCERQIAKLSKGYKQRVGIAQALLGNPTVIILDEPTVGLDPIQIIEIRDLIRELGKDHTVIFSSHILSEVQAICDKVVIISKGQLVAFDDTENLETSLKASSEIYIRTDATANEAADIIAGAQSIIKVTKPVDDVIADSAAKQQADSIEDTQSAVKVTKPEAEAEIEADIAAGIKNISDEISDVSKEVMSDDAFTVNNDGMPDDTSAVNADNPANKAPAANDKYTTGDASGHNTEYGTAYKTTAVKNTEHNAAVQVINGVEINKTDISEAENNITEIRLSIGAFIADDAAYVNESDGNPKNSDAENPNNGSCSLNPADVVCRALFFAFAKHEKAILEMSAKKANLEEIFLELTQSDISDEHIPIRKKTDSQEKMKKEDDE